MADRVLAPVVIGITGKRDLEGKAEAVGEALRQAFDELDARYPETPKVLLSGLAEGADTLAAEAALERASWRVVAALPLSLELYAEDFEGAAAARLRGLLAHPKVRTWFLEPLLDAHSGEPLAPAALSRRGNAGNPERTLHYEQVGLVIAERSALLIAVMAGDEKPGRIGGTARIADYRLRGELDSHARAVVERSQLLRGAMVLDRPRTGALWLIDLATVGGKPGTRPPHGCEVRLPGEEPQRRPWSDRAAVDESLLLVHGLAIFNRRALALEDAAWQRDVEARAGPDAGDAASALRRIRLALSAIQVRYNTRVKRSAWALALLFVAAILAFELHVELSAYWPLRYAVLAYLVLALVALGVFGCARNYRWQPVAEDYRAVSEALRVQLAWWDAGLGGPDHRVERFYLRGTLGSLGLVRAAVHQLLDAALLALPAPRPVENADRRWIDGQLKFFKDRIDARRLSVLRVEASSWFLFVASLAPAAALVAARLGGQGLVHAAVPSVWSQVPPWLALGATLLVVALLFWATAIVPAFVLRRYFSPHKGLFKVLGWLIALCTGFLLAFGLYDLAAVLPPLGEGGGGAAPRDELAERLVTMAAIFPPAVAGAIRFVAEKLSLEAEMRGYQDARKIFKRAKAALAAIDEAADEAPEEKAARRRTLFFVLGKEALEENERWLRAHRERPLEPLVGG